MAAILILVLLAGLYLLQKLLYDFRWSSGLETKIAFREEYAVEEQSSAMTEVVVNDKFLPLPVLEISFHMERGLRFTDEKNTAVSDRSYRRDIFALGVRQKITRTLEFRCAKRGYYRIDEAGLSARNLLLTQKYVKKLPQNTGFYVLPRPVPAERIDIPFSQIMGSVVSRKKIFDDPFEFAGLRGYSKSDPMKYINWKATAKTGEMLVNIHESTLSQKVTVVLDMEGLGVQQSDLLNEESVRIACSLCIRLLCAGIEIGLICNGTDVLTGKPFAMANLSGAGSVLPLQKQLACVQAGNGLMPIENLFPTETTESDLLCVLISRNQKETLSLEFSRFLGKREGVQIIPYRQEHAELPMLKNIRRLFFSV